MYCEYQQVVTSVFAGRGVSKHYWQCLYSHIKADGKQPSRGELISVDLLHLKVLLHLKNNKVLTLIYDLEIEFWLVYTNLIINLTSCGGSNTAPINNRWGGGENSQLYSVLS